MGANNESANVEVLITIVVQQRYGSKSVKGPPKQPEKSLGTNSELKQNKAKQNGGQMRYSIGIICKATQPSKMMYFFFGKTGSSRSSIGRNPCALCE